ncbi:hypothetical protein [Nocardia salmonicida]|uniref:hypothetical protein n=1 Tax=Nocardia salmonicida TaxID=53431 RepID=UPI002E2D5977|nr:hypothetical protein [Nocardia salmonicida]
MTVFSTGNRRAALALLGGAAVITATSAGIATADPGAPSHGGERTTIICTDPGDGVPDLPPLPDTGFHDAAPDRPRVEFRHVAPGEPGRGQSLPAPGNLGPRVDGPVECTRIDPDGGRTIVIAPREFSETVPAPGSGSAESTPAHPF